MLSWCVAQPDALARTSDGASQAKQIAQEPAGALGAVFGAAPPACVSCKRPHAVLRYCHSCGAEIFNAFVECADEDCPWETCYACHDAFLRKGTSGSVVCKHAQVQPHLLHNTPAANARLLQRVQQALALLAAPP